MSDMIERIAIATFVYNNSLALCSHDEVVARWNRLQHSARQGYRNRARAGLTAAREPTREMMCGLLRHRGYDPEAKEETLDTIGQLDIATMGAFTRAYTAMIDAALSSGERE